MFSISAVESDGTTGCNIIIPAICSSTCRPILKNEFDRKRNGANVCVQIRTVGIIMQYVLIEGRRSTNKHNIIIYNNAIRGKLERIIIGWFSFVGRINPRCKSLFETSLSIMRLFSLVCTFLFQVDISIRSYS